MGSLIDTSIFIDAERNRLDLDQHFADRQEDLFFMSVITASELLHGVHRATPAHKAARTAAVEVWIQSFQMLDIDLPTAREHARLFADLKASGNVIGAHDLWLAATCFTHDLKMVTANTREFERVPGLKVENWSIAP